MKDDGIWKTSFDRKENILLAPELSYMLEHDTKEYLLHLLDFKNVQLITSAFSIKLEIDKWRL